MRTTDEGWVSLINPHGLVNGILYSTQFERALDDEVVERIARALLEEPIMYLTPEQEYEAIVAGLRSDEPLTGQIPQPHDESTVREFLRRLLRRLDALRPWPELPFVRLRPELRPEFEGVRPIARVQVPILDIQTRLRDLFHPLADGREVLLLRLRSGVEVALIRVSGDDSALLQSSPGVPALQVIEEFRVATGFGPDEVTPLP